MSDSIGMILTTNPIHHEKLKSKSNTFFATIDPRTAGYSKYDKANRLIKGIKKEPPALPTPTTPKKNAL